MQAEIVVVGAGSAGCALAARLAENPSRTVLLLEAGPDRRAELPDELRDGWDIDRALFNWDYTSEPDERGNTVPVRRKKLVGGTSWLTRFTPRGGRADYDGWARRGNDGWGWEDVLPYFVRLESDDDFGDRPWHGDAGPMPSRRYLELSPTEPLAVAAGALEELGFPAVDDHNGPDAVGVGPMPMSSREGARVTTADAYLPLGATPPNLEIRGDAQVAEVIFDGVRAAGVRLLDGSVVEAGTVVLCAGVYADPALLLRSGIGPADDLRALGLEVRADLSGVGSNLADHPAVDFDLGYSGAGRDVPLLHSIATFHSKGRSQEEPPDLMFWLTDPTGDPPVLEFAVVLLQPEGRGSVRLRSADPADAPAITLPVPTAGDVDRLSHAWNRAVELGRHAGLRAACCGDLPPQPDDLRAWIRAESWSVPHTVGTCAMGPNPDGGAVVDTNGRVYGVEGLFVADASIMPEVPSGFTHFPTIMIAERLSERIPA